MLRSTHHLRSDNLPATMVPLVLFSDDVSGNRSKKWNGFDLWAMLLAGLPKEENTKLSNIHLLTASNKVRALELVEPIVNDLLKLEKGVIMYDAYFKTKVMVVAPVICILADNPRSSELLNHGGSGANKYCRICQVCMIGVYHACITKYLAIIDRQGSQSRTVGETKKQITSSDPDFHHTTANIRGNEKDL